MSLRDCLKTVSLDAEDEGAIRDLVAKAASEPAGVKSMLDSLQADLDEVRSQIGGQGFNVEAAKPKAPVQPAAPPELHDLQADIAQMREQGVEFTAEEQADLKAAQETYDGVVAYEKVLEIARSCVLQ